MLRPVGQGTQSASLVEFLPTMPAWRPMQPGDLDRLRLVAQEVHPDLPESDFVCLERIELFPEGCWTLVADAEHNTAGTTTASTTTHETSSSSNALSNEVLPSNSSTSIVLGYAISHPIRHDSPPALDSRLHQIASDADAYYIHDVALLPRARGGGLAAQCVNRLLSSEGPARRWPITCLISVYGTSGFWGRFGFKEPEEGVGEALARKVRGYGDDAVYLERRNG